MLKGGFTFQHLALARPAATRPWPGAEGRATLAPAMRPTITHIALHVADVEACIAFYRAVCGLRIVHERPASSGAGRVAWLAANGQEGRFVIVLLPGGPGARRAAEDFSHIGVAVERPAEIDEMAEAGRARGCLLMEPVDEGYPVGRFVCLSDPDGNIVEFSYGQPLGPGAPSLDDDGDDDAWYGQRSSAAGGGR
jgi:catechol 2,3-dioxygenase-like lactoylglutathione lyase family enzyme